MDEETLLIYVDFAWTDDGLSARTVGTTLRADATRTDLHNELLKQVGFDVDGSNPTNKLTIADQDRFDKALHDYADHHKPRYE